MSITIHLSTEAEQRLGNRAQAAGIDAPTYAERLLLLLLTKPESIEQISGPLQQQFRESGMTDDEWPNGEFGFVWGCYWGDDSSWKVQYLDLSRVQQGVVRREERFGYVELATSGFTSPCLSLTPEALGKISPPRFIAVSRHNGVAQVTFAVEMQFGLKSGRSEEWQRVKIANLE